VRGHKQRDVLEFCEGGRLQGQECKRREEKEGEERPMEKKWSHAVRCISRMLSLIFNAGRFWWLLVLRSIEKVMCLKLV